MICRALALLARRLRSQVVSFFHRDRAMRRSQAKFSAPCSLGCAGSSRSNI